IRERSFDWLLDTAGTTPSRAEVVVVDLDRDTLIGDPRALQRERLAELIERIAESKPRAIGLDILIDGPDERSPAALARRLAEETRDPRAAELARGLIDGDKRLATALDKAPVVMGAALAPEPVDVPARTAAPVLAQGK